MNELHTLPYGLGNYESYTEGNVRQVRLTELWTRSGAFAWNREMTKEKPAGFCAKCRYSRQCLGGCAGSKLTFCHSRLGRLDKGVMCMTKAIQLSGQIDSDYYLDLAVMFEEHKKAKDAIKLLDKIRKHSERFREKSESLYRDLKKKIVK